MKKLIASLLFAAACISGGCSADKDDVDEKMPSAEFTMSSKEVYKGDMVVFQNNSTDADRFEWDFGDGTTSGERNPSHTYNKCGTFGVNLIAWNGSKKDKCYSSVHVTSKNLEVQTNSVVLAGMQYYPNGKFVNGEKWKYEFTIKVKASYYGYRSASRWGIKIGSTNLWWDAESDEVKTLEIKHYTNNRSSIVGCKAYAVAIGGNTNGDAFGKTVKLRLEYGL